MPVEYTVILLALFALFIFIHYKTKYKYTKYLLLMLCTAVVSGVYTNVYTHLYQKSVDKISTDTMVFSGYIKEITNADNTGYIVAVTDEKGREIYNVSIYYGDYFALGDSVEITGKFKSAKSDKYIFSNYSKNIKGTVNVDKIVQTDIEYTTVKYKGLTYKTALLESAGKLYGKDHLAVISAIGYNDSHLLAKDTKSLFKTAGMSHALVVSGLHVGIIVVAVQSVLKYIPFDKRYKNLIAAVIMVAYMYLVGLSPSVIRAGFLVLAVILSKNIYKEQDSITSIAFIGLVSVIINPYITRNIGAMLSYTACIGILLTSKWCKMKKIGKTTSNLLCCAAAILFTIPVLSMANMYFTLLSPVYNLLLAVFITVICVLSLITPILNLIPILRIINIFLVMTNKYIIDLLLNILTFISNYLDFTTVRLHSSLWQAVILATVVAVFVACFQFDKRVYKNIFIVTVSISAFVCYNLLNCNMLTVTAFDSGREGSFHISAKGKEYIVLSEDITAVEAEELLNSATGKVYEAVYYCPKEVKNDIDMSTVSQRFITADSSQTYVEEGFTLTSIIEKNKKLFIITAADCDIAFGHGKITSSECEYYFLGNDKPKSISAEEVYIFGNTPDWMDVEDITNIDSEIRIKINLKNGSYKTVKDVLNFGYRL